MFYNVIFLANFVLLIYTSMHQKHHREIYYYKDYYINFFEPLKPEVKKKLNWTLQLITVLEYVPN